MRGVTSENFFFDFFIQTIPVWHRIDRKTLISARITLGRTGTTLDLSSKELRSNEK